MVSNPSTQIREYRDDLSPYLFHYTKGENAFKILSLIISDKKIKSQKGYICLTEAPITTSLRMFDYMGKFPNPMYAPYGIGFKRDFLFNSGARPVIYGTEEEIKKIPEEFKWRCLTLQPASYDFSWLREWRIEGNEFAIFCTLLKIVLLDEISPFTKSTPSGFTIGQIYIEVYEKIFLAGMPNIISSFV